MKNFHKRSFHNEQYNFIELIKSSNELEDFVRKNQYDNLSIDFASNQAVLALNKAILKHFYQINWQIPKKYLCPPIPGRVDYIHYLADLLALSNNNIVPIGNNVRLLDIGTGANFIYPILANSTYKWQVLASDIDKLSIQNANEIIQSNERFKDAISVVLQISKDKIFDNIINKNDKFDLTMCNPPFHKSKKEAKEESIKKIRNLSKGKKTKLNLNFGGQHNELWYEGGEVSFVKKMINESSLYKSNCLWFTTLISKKDNLETIYTELKSCNVKEVKTINMTQGNKQTRFIAWTFLSEAEKLNWFKSKTI